MCYGFINKVKLHLTSMTMVLWPTLQQKEPYKSIYVKSTVVVRIGIGTKIVYTILFTIGIKIVYKNPTWKGLQCNVSWKSSAYKWSLNAII